MKAEGVSERPQPWNGIKVMLILEVGEGKQHPQLPLDVGRFDWTTVTRVIRVPAAATKATLALGLDQVTGETVSVYDVPESVIRDTAAPVVQEYVHIEWPKAWQVIGPFPKGKPPLSPEDLKTIPEQVTVNGEAYLATPLKAVNHLADFTNLYGGYGLEPLAPGPQARRRCRSPALIPSPAQ